MLFGDGSTMIFLSIYFRFISNDWFGFQLGGLLATAVATIACFFVPESPKFYYSYKRYDEARSAIEYINRFNKGNFSGKTYKFDTEVAEENKIRTI